jgi:hypothetical protein
MSDFPVIYPSSITFSHGQPQTSEYTAFGVGPVRFRHSNFINAQRFTLTYQAIQQSSVDLIRNHYDANQGTAGEFAVPLAVLGNVNAVDSSTNFRYFSTPAEEHFGLYFNVTVELIALRGIELLFHLNGGPAALPAEETVDKFVFDGTAPFILNGSTSALATLILKAD